MRVLRIFRLVLILLIQILSNMEKNKKVINVLTIAKYIVTLLIGALGGNATSGML